MKRHDCFQPIKCEGSPCYKEMYGDRNRDGVTPNRCGDCWSNTGRCEDCIFEKSADCPLTNAASCDIIKPSN